MLKKRVEDEICFRRFGTMLDCSRNAVPTVPFIKNWIDITADLGYNTLMLYTEDTYEVDGEPYFGYMRGRYTKEELKEVDAYALSKGMELIPCIQTLAHLDALVRWPTYEPHVDRDNILLAGDEAVYELIDKMFSTLAQCFTSRIVNIGMDEAYMIGRGKYYDLHGDSNRSQVLIDHLKRVSEIGEKYGFRFMMWSDMFYRLATGEKYNPDAKINDDIKKQIPDNVELVYWAYRPIDVNTYDRLLESHKQIKEDTWFAGGLWMWSGFASHNAHSLLANTAAFKACKQHQVQDVILTMWGDNGSECSKLAMLPALFHASELAKGNANKASIKAKFKEKYGVSFDRYMLLDLPHTPNDVKGVIVNADKYLLYNDCFTGLLDSTIKGGENEQYATCARKLGLLKRDAQYGYLFATQQALCEVLAVKAELGVKTRRVYAGGDEEELKVLIAEYKLLEKKLKNFHKIFKQQWFLENKPHGFDVQDIRLGGLMIRVKSCEERLQALYDGKISCIEELEETQLDYGEIKHRWSHMVTANII